jgi:TonB family protein
VLAQERDPNEPVDLSGDTIVQGNAETYAGGFTTAGGTNPNAVRSAPVATGARTQAGPAPTRVQLPSSGPDRSRSASVGGAGTEWNVPFPPEADSAQIDDGLVWLQVDVNVDGTASAVRVISESSAGFGREAKRYALRWRFAPALDHDGTPIAATIKFKVKFSR